MKVKVNILIKNLGWLEIVPKEKALDSYIASEIGARLLEVDQIYKIEFTRLDNE